MQLTPISPSPQFSQKHQGNVRKLQYSPSQSPLQPEAPILFGKASKPKKLLLAVLTALALYSPAQATSLIEGAPVYHPDYILDDGALTKIPPINPHEMESPVYHPDYILDDEPTSISRPLESKDKKISPFVLPAVILLFLAEAGAIVHTYRRRGSLEK